MDKLRFLGLHAAAVSSEDASPSSPSAGTVIVLLPLVRAAFSSKVPSQVPAFRFRSTWYLTLLVRCHVGSTIASRAWLLLVCAGHASPLSVALPWRSVALPALLPNMSEQLLAREQHVGRLEALACLLGPWNHPEILKGRNVMHFIDNTSAVSGCIQGGSWVPDSSIIFQLHALSLAASGCRYWAEYVASVNR